MDEEVINAITEISIGHFTEELQNKPPEVHAMLSSYIRSYITGMVQFPVLEMNVQQLVGNAAPLKEIREIMEIEKEPIPETPESKDSEDSSDIHNKRKKSHPWSHYEDQRLIAGIMKHGIENWTSISRFVGNGRTRSQCSQRWMRGLDPKISKAQWSQQEEDLLLHLIQIHGNKAWTTISSQMRNRSDVQCRYKYKQLIKEKKIRPGAIPAMNPLIHQTISAKSHSPRQASQSPKQSPQQIQRMPQAPYHQQYYIPQMFMPQMMPQMQGGIMMNSLQQTSSPNAMTTPITPPGSIPMAQQPPQPVQLPPAPPIQKQPENVQMIQQQVTNAIPEQPHFAQQQQQPQQVQFNEGQTHLNQQQQPHATHFYIQDSPHEPKLPPVQPLIELANSPLQHSPMPSELLIHKGEKEPNITELESLHHATPSIVAPTFNAKLYSVY